MKRIFIVGVARSGTTLLQSLLGSHPEIFTFPESHFFSGTMPKKKLLRKFYCVRQADREKIRQFLARQNKLNLFEDYRGKACDLNKWTRYILSTIDSMSQDEGKSVWLEKTPMHLYYIDRITKNCPDCFFIHIIREPLANISALYDVSRKHPESFAQKTIGKAFRRYKREVSISERYLNRPNHFHLHYEELVNNPEETLQKLCQFLGIDFSPELLNYDVTVDRIVTGDEKWKSNNKKTLVLSNKVDERITEKQKMIITNKLKTWRNKLLAYYEKD